ncbi:MAG: isoleucine--tRNA ligase, partial [Bacteroidales bacterium]|nr:isoleucine--tRNA ligase [Bacteroidales bacterium]
MLNNEKDVLSFWKEKDVFNRSVSQEAKKGTYSFYDGPPFATGTPHYGHLVGSVIKDVIPRFATMNGYQVERKWGWDCHGLPIENIVEKELKTKTKKDIEELGIDKFNNVCRERVSTYIDDWKNIISRLGRFVDMDNAYRTMDLPLMESVWWAFKNLWDKGLIYKDHRSMHVCPRCETTLSQSEVSEGYQDVKDLSVVAKFRIKAGQKIKTKEGELELGVNSFALAWTTTPWTLIANAALAVGENIDYVIIEKKLEDANKENLILAKNVYDNKESFVAGKFTEDDKIVSTFKGSSLIGLEYEPVYDYYNQDESLLNRENAWKIYAADFVTVEDGVGIVHIAPAFGEDDLKFGRENKLPFIQHVGMDGVFRTEVIDFPALHVKPIEAHDSTDIEIIKNLAKRGLLFHKEKYEHSYPHCWRCDTPLINYATDSWFINVTKLKERLLETAKEINWSPEYLKAGRFGNWLEGARDWSISRQRFWASCIPIWECSCGERRVIGSVAELEELSGEKVTDLHKDKIDHITFACPKCGKTMKRIPDVLDCWFESGAMPYAQWHYPFENKEKVEATFPAHFIAEGVDQTRTWFYYLHVLAGGLMDSQAFKSVVVNGIVLAEDGKKMSKRLNNYPDPLVVMDKYGADALRAYLLSSPIVMAENLNFSEKGVQEALRKNIMLLFNVYKFYEIFSAEFPISENNIKLEPHVLDTWIKAKLKVLIAGVSAALEIHHIENKDNEINLPKAMRLITEFIDEFSTWYLRRSRDRFKSDNESERRAAVQTTREVFLNLTKVIAPFMPFVAEGIWQKVNELNFKTDNSVHLQAWPKIENLDNDENLVIDRMELVREVVSLGLAKRDEAGIRIRQMLNKVSILIKDKELKIELDDKYLEIIKEELNVKEAEIIIGAKDATFSENEKIKLELDTEITPELKREGIKRELIRSINMNRKDLDLGRTQSAKVYLLVDDKEIIETLEMNKEEIMKDTISSDISVNSETEEELEW